MILGVNIDHVATVRQARYRDTPDLPNCEPDPVAAALAAENGGAEGITAHLRADRRHIQDRDLFQLRELIRTKLNLEMGNTPEIISIALDLRPADVCLVPEEREEVTTEGGLDCAAHHDALRDTIARLKQAAIRVSLFIDPEEKQIEAAAALGADFVELHTGAFANASGELRKKEYQRLKTGVSAAVAAGLRVNAGHGINYGNITEIRNLPNLVELNIGHSIVSRAVFVGMETAVREMLALMNPHAPRAPRESGL